MFLAAADLMAAVHGVRGTRCTGIRRGRLEEIIMMIELSISNRDRALIRLALYTYMREVNEYERDADSVLRTEGRCEKLIAYLDEKFKESGK